MVKKSSIRIYLISLLSVVSSYVLAGPVDVRTARIKAEKFFNAELENDVVSQSVDRDYVSLNPLCVSETRSANEVPEYYVFIPEDSVGFVIVSGEDGVEPVVGYSLNSRFGGQQLPPALDKYLASYRTYIHKLRDGGQCQPMKSRANVMPVKPFITTTWNQGYPYNYYTPKIGSERTLAGCFAIAIAQIMKYYEWPVAGKGTCTATLKNSTNTQRTINLGKEYDWANMLDDYTGSYTNIEKTAVAALIRDVGYACSSIYGTNETWAYTVDALKALLRHFYYSPEIRLVDRKYYSDETWAKMLQEELALGRPVWFCGQDENEQGGHSFICCGIDSQGRYYINWGWGGYCDGYFDLNAFSPDQYAYNIDQQAIINIVPMDEEESEDEFELIPHVGNLEIIDQWNFLSNPGLTYNIYVTNTSDQVISGKVGLSISGSDGEATSETMEVKYYDGIEPNWWWRYELFTEFDGAEFQTKGIREIRFFWQPEGSDDWFTPLGENNVLYMETTDAGHYFHTERPEGVPDNIRDVVADDVEVSISGNVMLLMSSKRTNVDVYSINGTVVRRLELVPNRLTSVPLNTGVYIVNGRKFVVN